MSQVEPIFLSVIVPAYNEAGRIGQTLKAVDQFFSQKEFSYEIVVVDDGSQDSTQKVVESLKISRLRVVNYGQNRGKGYAVHFGVEESRGKWILFTDADSSTPIDQFDRLFQQTDRYKVIIGSRYLKESNITVHQSTPRIILSRLGNLLVQLLILPGLKDTQCGFKLFLALDAKEIFKLQTIWRWGFDMEILRIARERGLKIKEVPIIWRNDDQSRIQSGRVFTSTLVELLNITYNSLRGRYRPTDVAPLGRAGLMIRFAIVGATGTALDFAVLNFTHLSLGFGLATSLTLGFLTGAINNYLLNSWWTYAQSLSWSKFGRFLMMAFIGLLINNATVIFLADFSHWHYNVAKLLAVVIVFFWNYAANKRWTFTQSATH